LRKGLVIVFTGDGKGKTTSALGIALRACGHGMKVLIIQFIKGSRATGELKAIKRLSPEIEIIHQGKGFIGIRGNNISRKEHIEAAENALKLAKEKIQAGGYDIVILDEINNAVSLNLIPIEDVLESIKNRPPELHLILTGRNAHASVIELADLVTEMRNIKHPYKEGITAQKGVDF